jgi:hypothetical protein
LIPLKKQKEIVRQLAKNYNVRVRFAKSDEYSGLYRPPNRIIINNSDEHIILTFFHELGHHYCYQNNIFPVYHGRVAAGKATLSAMASTAWRAEQWVDRWAKAECKQVFPELNWIAAYSEEDRKWLSEYAKKWLKEQKKLKKP